METIFPKTWFRKINTLYVMTLANIILDFNLDLTIYNIYAQYYHKIGTYTNIQYTLKGKQENICISTWYWIWNLIINE